VTLFGNVVYVFIVLPFCVCVLFLFLHDNFGFFGEIVIVDWVFDLFTKVMYVGFLYGFYML
jgi:hypothetical protein